MQRFKMIHVLAEINGELYHTGFKQDILFLDEFDTTYEYVNERAILTSNIYIAQTPDNTYKLEAGKMTKINDNYVNSLMLSIEEAINPIIGSLKFDDIRYDIKISNGNISLCLYNNNYTVHLRVERNLNCWMLKYRFGKRNSINYIIDDSGHNDQRYELIKKLNSLFSLANTRAKKRKRTTKLGYYEPKNIIDKVEYQVYEKPGKDPQFQGKVRIDKAWKTCKFDLQNKKIYDREGNTINVVNGDDIIDGLITRIKDSI